MSLRDGVKHIAALPVVAHTTEEGDELGVILIGPHTELPFILSVSTAAEVVVLKRIVGEVLIRSVQP